MATTTTSPTFTTTYAEALRAFGRVRSGSAFGKWVVANLDGAGFWSGADYDFSFALRDLIAAGRAVGKRLRQDAPLTFRLDDAGRGIVEVGHAA